MCRSNLIEAVWLSCIDLADISSVVASNLSQKCEALAFSGLVEYGDEIGVIAHVDILKQIFAIPYYKAAGVSLAVQRVRHTLVLSPGVLLPM